MLRLLRLVPFLLLLATGCGRSETSESIDGTAAPAPGAAEADEAKREAAPAETAKPTEPASAETQSPLLIYTANLTLEVDNPIAARDSALRWVRQAGGYSGNENQQQLGNREALEVSLRVPAGQFQPVMNRLVSLARRVEDRRVVAMDVTQEYTDNESRLRTKRATEAQYLELLKRAGKISEVLEVQNQLNAVREEIELIEGRQRYYRNQIGYSTITVSFFRLGESPVYAKPSFWTRFAENAASGWDGLLNFLLALVSIWPLWLILALGYWAWRRWGQRLRKS